MSKNKCKVVWKGNEAIAESHDILLDALLEIADRVLYSAKQNAPRDTGALHRSGCVTIGLPPNPNEVYSKAEKGSGRKSVLETPTGSPDDDLVVYVTFNTPYATRLHEVTEEEGEKPGKGAWTKGWKPSDTSRRPRTNKKTGKRYYKEIKKRFTARGGPKYLEKAAEEHWKDFPKVVRKIARDKRKR